LHEDLPEAKEIHGGEVCSLLHDGSGFRRHAKEKKESMRGLKKGRRIGAESRRGRVGLQKQLADGKKSVREEGGGGTSDHCVGQRDQRVPRNAAEIRREIEGEEVRRGTGSVRRGQRKSKEGTFGI